MAGTPHAGQSRPRNHSATPADAAESGLSLVNPAWLLIGFTLATIAAGTALLALPISASSGGASLLDALFTATSAATTTGLVVVDTPTFWSYTGHNVVMWLVIAGGAGSLIGSTMLLLLIASRVADEDRFLLKEFTGVQSPRGMVLLITGILVYAFLVQWGGSYVMARELSATMPEGVAGWFARFHAVTAFNNAGFDIMDMAKNTPPARVQLLLTSLSLLGAVGFIVVIDLFKGITRRHLALDTRMVLAGTATLVLIGAITIFATESGNPQTLGPLSLPQRLLAAAFHSVTARTTGFSTVNIGLFVNAALLMVIVLMFVGGASGSTAGGIKVNTFVLLAGVTWSFIRGRPHPSVFGSKIDEAHLSRALAIVLLSVILVFGVTFALSLTEGKPLLAILFETVSAYATAGLSMGITSSLTDTGKLLITFAMFVGKVGPITLAFAISQRQRVSYHSYAQEAINLG